MINKLTTSPRLFSISDITISDYGEINLKPWEMISIVNNNSNRCDITMTEWGIYLGSSLNGRLKAEGYKTALVKNEFGKIFINVVLKDKLETFKEYLMSQNSTLICWLDENPPMKLNDD